MNKKCFENIIIRALTFVLVFVILGTNSIKVSATEQKEAETETTEAVFEPLIVVDYYEITNEKIVPGEDFTLTLMLKNYSMNQPAKGVLLDISNPAGVAPVYGTISQVYVGDIGAGESKEVVVEYNSWTTIVGDTLDFNVTIISDSKQNYAVLRVPVGVDSPFSIISVTAPSEVEVYGLATLSLTFKVIGEEKVKDVVLAARADGVLIGSSQIGIISPGLTMTQQLLLSFVNTGEQTIDLSLEYVDEQGQKEVTSVTTTTITVIEETPGTVIDPASDDISDGNTESILLMGIGGMLILIVFLIFVIVVKKKR